MSPVSEFGWWRHKDQNFKVITDYIVSLRPACETHMRLGSYEHLLLGSLQLQLHITPVAGESTATEDTCRHRHTSGEAGRHLHT